MRYVHGPGLSPKNFFSSFRSWRAVSHFGLNWRPFYKMSSLASRSRPRHFRSRRAKKESSPNRQTPHREDCCDMKPLLVNRWRKRLAKELAFRAEFERLDSAAWKSLLATRSVTSTNHDTVLSLDWPHYCAYATVACGGPNGWCYTFQGRQTSQLHNRHAAMV